MLINDIEFNCVESKNKEPTSSGIKQEVKKRVDNNPRFKRFLEENHVYGRYIKNITKTIEKSCDSIYRLKRISSIIESSINNNGDIINLSMTWNKTSEGHEFWSKIYKKGYNKK